MKLQSILGVSICLFALTACIPPIPILTPKLYLHPVKGPIVSQIPKCRNHRVLNGIRLWFNFISVA